MYFKLALRNVKRQVGNYLIYFITVSLTVAFLFAINNIVFSDNMSVYVDLLEEFKFGLIGLVVLISLIIAFVLSYATSFMLKLRKREFGTYLTLGMSRKNILNIFIVESVIICIAALIFGLIIGLIVFQGFMAIFMNVLEMQFEISSYSINGMLFTIILVLGIFIFSSLASALYLKKTSIYQLIHGDKKVEKDVKHSRYWFVVTLFSLGILIGSCILFKIEIDNVMLKNGKSWKLMLSLLALVLSVFTIHVGAAKSIIYFLLRRKKLRCKGTNTFMLRQLSASTRSNSIMLGVIAFLLTFAVIISNVSFMQKVGQEAALNKNYPYDITYSKNVNEENQNENIPIAEAEKIIEKYAKIKSKIPYCLYTSGKKDFYDKTSWLDELYKDNFMSLSDYNAICVPLGYEPIVLQNEYLIVSKHSKAMDIDWSSTVFDWNGVSYNYKDISVDYLIFSILPFYIIIPDNALAGMELETTYISYDLGGAKYNVSALIDELSYKIDGPIYDYIYIDYRLKEEGRQTDNSMSAILVVGSLFISAVFLFMAMAILALKTLSTLSEDRKRYQVLFQLGTSSKEQSKALFRQTFFFFLLPFLIPVLLSIPIAFIGGHFITIAISAALAAKVYLIATTIAVIMILIYALYYIATYFTAKRAILR